MKNKGFTLIELLAVIVILAIIALIAVPIVINIINDSRESSYKRSIDNYGKAVEQAIANYQINNPNNEVKGIYKTNELEATNGLSINYEGSEVNCDTIYIYNEGNIYIANCKIGTHDVDYSFGKNPVTKATASTKTTGNVPEGNYTPGDEYIIHIGGEDRIFFVLGINSQDSSKVDLIMNQNIGDPVEWGYVRCSGTTSIVCIYGPYIAEAYLSSQTLDWEVSPTIKSKLSFGNLGCTKYSSSCPSWLWGYLSYENGVRGYWTSTQADSNISTLAKSIRFSGLIASIDMSDSTTGVRPVITLPKSELN